jgi:hypothetical protein
VDSVIRWLLVASVVCYLTYRGLVSAAWGDECAMTSTETPRPVLTASGTAVGEGLRDLNVDPPSPEQVRGEVDGFLEAVRMFGSSVSAGFAGEPVPERVATWEAQAVSRGCTPGPGDEAPPVLVSAGACPATGSRAERGLTPAASKVLRCGARQFGITSFAGVGSRSNVSDHPSGRAVDLMVPAWSTGSGRALGDRIAAWYVANGEAFSVRYVIWADEINSLDGRGWRPYGHPSCRSAGCGSATVRHLDHVHVSVTSGRVA